MVEPWLARAVDVVAGVAGGTAEGRERDRLAAAEMGMEMGTGMGVRRDGVGVAVAAVKYCRQQQQTGCRPSEVSTARALSLATDSRGSLGLQQ